MSLLQDFKAFALKGSAVDMAIGIILGAAIGKVISSFVGDIVMPPLGYLLGGVDFSDLAITLKSATNNAGPVVIAYGRFIQTLIDFIIVAFAVFMGVKLVSRLRVTHDDDNEVELLTQIRDLLKAQQAEQLPDRSRSDKK